MECLYLSCYLSSDSLFPAAQIKHISIDRHVVLSDFFDSTHSFGVKFELYLVSFFFICLILVFISVLYFDFCSTVY